jgi:hypothetical protein
MNRQRSIAAAPRRLTGETWDVIAKLISDTLARSPHIDTAEVSAVLATAAQVGRPLLAGGHLQADPLILVAAELRLEITTVSNDEALTLEENLNPVPGAASATDWTLHMPAGGPLGTAVKALLDGRDHLSHEPPQAASSSASLAEAGPLLDEAALRDWAEES